MDRHHMPSNFVALCDTEALDVIIHGHLLHSCGHLVHPLLDGSKHDGSATSAALSSLPTPVTLLLASYRLTGQTFPRPHLSPPLLQCTLSFPHPPQTGQVKGDSNYVLPRPAGALQGRADKVRHTVAHLTT